MTTYVVSVSNPANLKVTKLVNKYTEAGCLVRMLLRQRPSKYKMVHEVALTLHNVG